MLTDLLEHGPDDVRNTLAASRDLVEKGVLGRPEVARRLLDSLIPHLQPHSSLSSATMHSLVMLVDACADEGRAQALVQRTAPAATGDDFYFWGAAASQSEFQRAAATFACAGLAATGSHLCAELAVFRLAASDGARRAIEIALATDWGSLWSALNAAQVALDRPGEAGVAAILEQFVHDSEHRERIRAACATAGDLGDQWAFMTYAP